MVQGYYTLPEAAQVLGMPADELKQMAQKGQIRSFQDRGSWRFRIQDVQELARQRGSSSDPDLNLGEAPRTPHNKQASPRTPPKAGPEVFDFSLEGERVDVGQEMLVMETGPGSGGRKSGVKSDPKRSPRSPIPASSDSDVRLVNEATTAGSDSDVKLVGHDSDVRLGRDASPRTPRASGAPTSSGAQRRSAMSPQPKRPGQSDSSPKRPSRVAPADSGSKLAMDSDSDVKIVPAGSDEAPLGDQPGPSPTDSDIRVEEVRLPVGGSAPRKDSGMLTDEIDLDAELRKQQEKVPPPSSSGKTKLKKKSKLQFPTTSPFELSDSDLDIPGAKPLQAKAKPDSSDFDLSPGKKKKKDSSSDFDLVPSKDGGIDLASDSDSGDFSLQLPDDAALAGEEVALKGPSSGISLSNPVDAGISLETNEESLDFDLSLQAESTPRPSPAPVDSDSEFELSLDADDSSGEHAAGDADSSSEFELTLDDSGVIGAAPQAKAGAGEKDIFDTDFEVPGLEDESGSQVAALDTDLDSSDFDIALDDSATEEEESASQVVSLDEEADEAAATVAAKGGAEVEEEEEGLEGLEEEPVTVAGGAVREVVREKIVQPAPWGPLPVIFMLPCVVVMILTSLLGFELVQSANGYKAPGVLTKAVAELMGQKLK